MVTILAAERSAAADGSQAGVVAGQIGHDMITAAPAAPAPWRIVALV